MPQPKTGAPPGVYRRHRPETTALYEVVRDNIETLFGAIDDGALAFRIPGQPSFGAPTAFQSGKAAT